MSRSILTALVLGLVAYAAAAADKVYSESGEVHEPIAIPAGTVYEIFVADYVVVTNTGAITGEGSLKLTGNGMLALKAKNTFSGGLEINGGMVNALVEGCLGSGTIRCTSTEYRQGINFLAPGAVFANDIIFENLGTNAAPKGVANDFDSLHLYFGTTTTLDGDIRVETGGSKTFFFGGNYYDQSGKVTFNGDFLMGGTETVRLYAYGDMIFNGRVNFVGPGNIYLGFRWSCDGRVYFNNSENILIKRGKLISCYAPVFHVGADNALGTNAIWCARYIYNSSTSSQIYLHGVTQRMRGMSVDPMPDLDSSSSATDTIGEGLRISADGASTLVFTGIEATEDYCPVKFAGPLDFIFDADDSAQTLVLSNRVHSMTGAFIVSNGTVRTVGETSFAAVRAVEVATGAAFDFQTPLAEALADCVQLKIDGTFTYLEGGTSPFSRPSIALGAAAAVYLGDNTIVNARQLVVEGLNDNQPLPDGDYTSTHVPQLKDGAVIKVRARLDYWPQAPVEPVYTVTTDVAGDNTNPFRLDEMQVEVTQNGITEIKKFSEIEAPVSGTLRKLGEGWLVSSARLAEFKGDIWVEEGVFAINDNLQTGPQVFGEGNTAAIWVKPGASFGVIGTADTCGADALMLLNTFHLGGTGHQGQGAILNHLTAKQCDLFSGKWILEDDVMVSTDSTYRWDWDKFTLDMNYHTLTFERRDKEGTVCFNNIQTAERMGPIVFKGLKFQIQSTHSWTAKGRPEVRLMDDAQGRSAAMVYYNSHIRVSDLPLVVDGPGAVAFSVGGSDKEESWFDRGKVEFNCWYGPMVINSHFEAYSSVSRRGLAANGPVSGTGRFSMRNGVLQLSGNNSAFKGDVVVRSEDFGQTKGVANMAELIVYKPESLTPATRFVTVTNAPVTLWDDGGYYKLPPFEVMTPAETNLTFSGGRKGTLAALTKTGAGTLEFTAPLAVTGALEVAEGTLDWAGKPLEVDTLLAGGGTVNGDIAVKGNFTLSPRAVSAAGAAEPMTVNGRLELASGMKVDFSRAAASAGLKGEQVLLTARDGIYGTLGADESKDKPRWGLFIEENRIIARRLEGTVILFR